MSETRQDKRAMLSVKIRYKSGSLAEFAERYSNDISRGGVFIRTKSPLPVGTLLKFEFQLQDESPLIHGVGRVIWRRNESDADAQSPEGMGLKFIKMDMESRERVQQIVDERGTEAGAFESGETPTLGAELEEVDSFDDDRTAVRDASEFLDVAIAAASTAVDAKGRAELHDDAVRVKQSSQTFRAVKERQDQTPVRPSVPPGAAYPEHFDDDAVTHVGEIPSNIAELMRVTHRPAGAEAAAEPDPSLGETPAVGMQAPAPEAESVSEVLLELPVRNLFRPIAWMAVVALLGLGAVALWNQAPAATERRESKTAAVDRAPQAGAADRAPRAVAADREPPAVAADREPQAAAVDREPQAGAADRAPEAVAVDREPQAVAVDREPRAVAAARYAIEVTTEPPGARAASGRAYVRSTPGVLTYEEMPERQWVIVRKAGYERARQLVKREQFVEEGERRVLRLSFTLTKEGATDPAAAPPAAQPPAADREPPAAQPPAADREPVTGDPVVADR